MVTDKGTSTLEEAGAWDCLEMEVILNESWTLLTGAVKNEGEEIVDQPGVGEDEEVRKHF